MLLILTSTPRRGKSTITSHSDVISPAAFLGVWTATCQIMKSSRKNNNTVRRRHMQADADASPDGRCRCRPAVPTSRLSPSKWDDPGNVGPWTTCCASTDGKVNKRAVPCLFFALLLLQGCIGTLLASPAQTAPPAHQCTTTWRYLRPPPSTSRSFSTLISPGAPARPSLVHLLLLRQCNPPAGGWIVNHASLELYTFFSLPPSFIFFSSAVEEALPSLVPRWCDASAPHPCIGCHNGSFISKVHATYFTPTTWVNLFFSSSFLLGLEPTKHHQPRPACQILTLAPSLPTTTVLMLLGSEPFFLTY